jgi:phosphoribosylformylglycinamidine synthase subunit PurS
MGHGAIADVRQGKYFDIAIAEGTTRREAEAQIEQIARDILANPVIEDYRFEIHE